MNKTGNCYKTQQSIATRQTLSTPLQSFPMVQPTRMSASSLYVVVCVLQWWDVTVLTYSTGLALVCPIDCYIISQQLLQKEPASIVALPGIPQHDAFVIRM